jgi:chorismate mutase/prephenate dehydrogenase
MTSKKELESLREELGRVDVEIFALVARRLAIAGEIGRAKQASGAPTRDFAQEKDVLSRARGEAERRGFEPLVAEALARALIEASLTRQEEDRIEAQGSGGGRRVLIIGGAGKMGRWLGRFLASQGFAVEVADPAGAVDAYPHRASWSEGALDHDLVAVAAPLRESNQILEELAAAPPRGVVFDVGSLKTPLRSGLSRLVSVGARVTSIHPMFGPDTRLLSGRHVVFVDLGVREATDTVRELFASTTAVQVEMDLDSHDRLVAYVLGLAHALNIAFFTALAESGETAPKLAKLSSTTFDAQLDVARRVAQENAHLYFDIQHLNDYGTESLAALLYAVERIRSLVRAGDEAGFVELMRRGRNYLERGETRA